MDKHELIEWMGAQRATGTFDDVKIVVDCPSQGEAQEVADAITEILGRNKYDTRNGRDSWWQYLFLFDSASNRSRCINSYSSSYRGKPLENVDYISPAEFFAVVRDSHCDVMIDDLL